jgi:hydroxymethylbilane synthase
MDLFDKKNIVVGARSSPLSRVQVDEVLREIRQFFPSITFDPIWVETSGDKDLITSLKVMDKTDFFTREIDQMLESNQCRIAIHSAKDLPDPLPAGLACASITKGVDPSDVIVLREEDTLSLLPIGAKVATSSLRREQAIKELRDDFICVDIRGTIAQRLHLLDTCKVDAVVMAEAALIRLKLTNRNRVKLPGPVAKGQGQLAIIARSSDTEMLHIFRLIDAAQGVMSEF